MALVLEIRTTSKKAAAEIRALANKAGASVKTLEKKSTTSSKKMTKGFKDFNKILGGLGLGLGIAAAVKGFNNLVSAASDTEESMNKVIEVFGGASDAVIKFSEDSAESLGASTEATLAMTGEIGNLLVAMKFAEDDAAGFSTKMVQLAADLGSFNNVPTADALNAIRSALVGESEPIRRFGADVRQTRLDSIALGMGLEFTKGKMDAQTKALAAMEAIMQDTRKAQGDFRRTSDGFANSQKILAANFGDLQAIMGEKLIPTMKSAVDLLTGFIKTFTESEFDKAIGRLIELGADVNFINQLKVQNQINESLKDRTRLAEEINDFELKINKIALERSAREKGIDKLTGASRVLALQNVLAGQLEIAKTTKNTEDAQKTINTLQQISFGINEKNVAIATDIAKATSSQIRNLRQTEDIIVKTIDRSTNFLLLLKEQETIETRIKELKSGESTNQNIVNNLAQQNLEIIKLTGEVRTDDLEEELDLLKERADIENTFISQTQTEILFSNKLVKNMFEISNGIAQGVLNAEKLSEVLSRIIRQLASRALAGLIAGGIAALIPGGGFLSTFRSISGFQSGGSFTVPGTGSGDRPHLLNLEPGERVDVTPRNQVTNNNNNSRSAKINITAVTIDEQFVMFKLIPMLNSAVRDGSQLLSSTLVTR